LLYNSALEYAIRKVQVNQDGLKLNGTHQLLAYADDFNILGGSIHTVKKNAEALVFCRMETETVQHIIFCCEALARQRYNVFGRLIAKPRDISTASVRDLCRFIRGTGLLNLC
jgi:hypothetical protein